MVWFRGRGRAGGRSGDSDRFMVPMHGIRVVGAFHEPQGAAGILPAEESGRSSADETSAAPYWRHRLTRSRFMLLWPAVHAVLAGDPESALWKKNAVGDSCFGLAVCCRRHSLTTFTE